MKITLEQLVDQILDAPTADLFKQKALVDQLVDCLCGLTELELHPDIFLDEDATVTAHGKAVSMITAAQCAEEFMRTQVFLRGVYQAICDQLQQQSTVNLLYAGTGPFGLLVIPLLYRFQSNQVRVTLLDIHEQSLTALTQVIKAFEVEDYIERIECVDILQWPLPSQPCFDLIVSETMKAMLEQEPQVAVFSHLVPALKETGCLIPESIQIKAWLSANKVHKDIYLADIFTLNQDSALSINQGDKTCLKGQVPIPEYPSEYFDLKFTTDIQVYRQHWLKTGRCSLNIAKQIVHAQPKPGTKLKFNYKQGRYPEFQFDYVKQSYDLDCLLPASAELSARGIPFIKRMWQAGQLLHQGGELAKLVLEKEFGFYNRIAGVLNNSVSDMLSLMTNNHGVDHFEGELLKLSGCSVDVMRKDLICFLNRDNE